MKNVKKGLLAVLCLAFAVTSAGCLSTGDSTGGSTGGTDVVDTGSTDSSDTGSSEIPDDTGSTDSSDTGSSEIPDDTGSTEIPDDSTGSGDENPDDSTPDDETYKITFKQDGQADVVVDVKVGETIAADKIPTPAEKTGYNVVWNVEDFTTITEAATVEAVETAMTFTVTYIANGGVLENDTQTVTYDAEYTTYQTSREFYEFQGWFVVGENGVTNVAFESGTWTGLADITVSAAWEEIAVDGEYAAKFNFNVTDEQVAFITKDSYPAGSVVSFKYFIPEGTTTGWWGIAWNTDPSQASIYNAAGIYPDGTPFENRYALSKVVGEWVDVSFTMTSAGYLYFGSEMGAGAGNWMIDGVNSYALIDNFKVVSSDGTFEDTFNTGVTKGLFNVNVPGGVLLGDGYVKPVIEPGEYAAKLNFNVTDEQVAFITKNSYPAGSVVEFSYFIPEGTTTGWWGIAWNTDPSQASIYNAAGIYPDGTPFENRYELSTVVGEWVNVSFTMTSAGYLYFGSEMGASKGNWMIDDVNSYALIDDFSVTTGDTVVADDFNTGLNNVMFNVNVPNAVELGEGYVAPVFEEGEYAAKYIFNVAGENVSFMTKNSYLGGSTVSFKYFIPAGTETKWWGIAWTMNETSTDIYAAASDQSAYPLGTVTGEWTSVKFTLPAGMPMYLYFGSEVGHWLLDGDNAYVLIDDFTVTTNGKTVTDDFNTGVDNGLFNVKVPGAVKLSAKGEGFVGATEDPDVPGEATGEYAMKYIPNATDELGLITKEAYAGGSTVSFKYFIPAGTTVGWWGIAWHTDASQANNYHAAGVENAMGHQSLGKALGVWADVEFTLPADGSYYLYFGSEMGNASNNNWTVNGEASYVLIDNFTVNGETETFNFGMEESIFEIKKSKKVVLSADGDGYCVKEESLATKIQLSKISSTTSTPTFITKQAYVSDGTLQVTFDYYTNGSDWWMFGWTNDQKVASIYAHVESNQANNYGQGLPLTNGEWKSVTITVPAGTWYFYIAGNKPDCNSNKSGCGSNCHMVVDNFAIGNQVTETFNYGIGESIFTVSPFSSHHSAIEAVVGKED